MLTLALYSINLLSNWIDKDGQITGETENTSAKMRNGTRHGLEEETILIWQVYLWSNLITSWNCESGNGINDRRETIITTAHNREPTA